MRGKKGVRSDGRAGLPASSFAAGRPGAGKPGALLPVSHGATCWGPCERQLGPLGKAARASGEPRALQRPSGAELHWAAPGQGSPPQAALDGQTRDGGDTAAEATRKMPVQMCATRPSHRLWGCVLALPPPHGWRRTRCAQRSCSREPWQGVGAAVEGILRSLKHALRCRFTESACPSAGRHAQGHPLGRGNAEATRTPVGARTHRT